MGPLEKYELPILVTRECVRELRELSARGSFELLVPDSFNIEPMTEQAALLWIHEISERNPEGMVKFELTFDKKPPAYKPDSEPSFTNSLIGYALGHACQGVNYRSESKDRYQYLNEIYKQELGRRDEIRNASAIYAFLKWPRRTFPRPFEFDRTSITMTEGMDNVVNSIMSRLGLGKQYELGTAHLSDFVFQALQNSHEEYEEMFEQNIRLHAGFSGFIARAYGQNGRERTDFPDFLMKPTQKYRDTREPFYSLSVTDLGRGIHETIRAKFPDVGDSTHDYVKAAFDDAISTKSQGIVALGQGQGLGKLNKARDHLDAVLVVDVGESVFVSDKLSDRSSNDLEFSRFEDGFFTAGTSVSIIWAPSKG